MAETTPTNTPNKQAEPTAVLCVDNDELANTTVRNIIGDDAHVWTARNFKQAIAAINNRAFSLVFCDITSPEVQGMDVLSILADLYPSTPVIITSGTAGSNWTGDAFNELGAFAAMQKPYNLGLLRVAINEALWPKPVMGKGEVGRAVLLNAGIHEPAHDEMQRLTEDERNEVRTVADVLERIMPFFSAQERPIKEGTDGG